MKTNQKNVLEVFVLASFYAIIIFGCNSPSPIAESSETIEAETIHGCNTDVKNDIISAIESIKHKHLILIINNLESSKAPVNVVFYQVRHKFLSKTDLLKGYTFVSNGNTLIAEINDINYGEFAIAAYQDVNSDGTCNRNLIGIPKEPYGFSNNFKPKLKAPHYGDCKFAYNADSDTLIIAMLR